MTTELLALLGDRLVGHLRKDRHGKMSFTYADEWRDAPNAYPLSLSMPLALAEHRHGAVDPYLWGLLPDNELILERWAQRFQVSARNAFALLAHVGEDCAGSVRFVRPERRGVLATGSEDRVDWLHEREIAARLRTLREDASAWRQATDTGQFSLAGAQPKTAFFFDGKRWGIPSGTIPTTHILKPGAPGLDGHAENEHFCLLLARELGMAVASSRVERFEDEVAIVVERYDRFRTERGFVRVHQEDICQALAIHPARKYENEGGPGARDVVALLREYSGEPTEDIATFIDALAFNWLIAGTDAHAKNYSLLIGPRGGVRLAPLYDLASALPYANKQFQKLKLAMSIGGTYRLRDIGVHRWEKLANELSFDAITLRARVRGVAESLPRHATALLRRSREEGLSHPILASLADALKQRAAQCLAHV
ncbi:MAG TPA: type II toxin-antitoxin system HipA family toxin [Polyangiaceae bacterium]|nr:type II toxin-antitoxin system HipA family toxin [Polyangiaceae bacterium]